MTQRQINAYNRQVEALYLYRKFCSRQYVAEKLKLAPRAASMLIRRAEKSKEVVLAVERRELKAAVYRREAALNA